MSDEKIEDGGPAFPSEDFEHGFHQDTIIKHSGMTLRDWFAGQQLRRIGSGWPNDENMKLIAESCYAMADAMLAARK